MSALTSIVLEDTSLRRVVQGSAARGARTWLHRLTEAHILFPALTLLVLGLIWGGTLNLIHIERTDATAASAAAVLELVDTYEAQVVRALREIDQTLKLVEYLTEMKGASAALTELKARGLLPPDLLFVVSIVNANGQVVASTRPTQGPSLLSPALQQGLLADAIWVDQPRINTASGEWTLQFGRALIDTDGTRAGAVLLAVDASYFVSSYDPSLLGKKGVLGLLGTDGVFRVRRTGETVTAGERIDYPNAVPAADQDEPVVSLSVNSWDGVRRFTGAHQLYEFPLVVIGGLSETEQLAGTRHHAQVYLWRAAIGSALLVLLSSLLGRMSWQLARSRAR